LQSKVQADAQTNQETSIATQDNVTTNQVGTMSKEHGKPGGPSTGKKQKKKKKKLNKPPLQVSRKSTVCQGYIDQETRKYEEARKQIPAATDGSEGPTASERKRRRQQAKKAKAEREKARMTFETNNAPVLPKTTTMETEQQKEKEQQMKTKTKNKRKRLERAWNGKSQTYQSQQIS
jgi:hypothetical protein